MKLFERTIKIYDGESLYYSNKYIAAENIKEALQAAEQDATEFFGDDCQLKDGLYRNDDQTKAARLDGVSEITYLCGDNPDGPYCFDLSEGIFYKKYWDEKRKGDLNEI